MKIRKNSPHLASPLGERDKVKAFTLVELIVVITILAILGTIAFISLQGFSKDARNSTRASDLKNIEKVLSLYQLRASEFPTPSNGVVITYSGAEVWTQGTFGEDTRKLLGSQGQISNVPLDPLTGSEYTYSVLNTGNEYQIAGVFEGDYYSSNSLLNDTYAAGAYGTTYIKGNYNGQVAKTSTGTKIYVLAVPSIISGDIALTDVLEIINAKKLIYKGFNSLPASYSGATQYNNEAITGNIVNTGSFLVYETTDINTLNEKVNQNELIDNLQNAYENTIIEEEDGITEIVNITPGNKTYLAQTLIRNTVIPSLEVTAENNQIVILYSNCKEILDNGKSIGDGVYNILKYLLFFENNLSKKA